MKNNLRFVKSGTRKLSKDETKKIQVIFKDGSSKILYTWQYRELKERNSQEIFTYKLAN